MDFASKMKVPKLDFGGAAAALQNIPKLLECFGTIGKELGDIVGALGGIATVVGSGEDFGEATKHVEEIKSSKSILDQNIHSIEDILIELKKAVGDDDDDNKPVEKKSKIHRIMDATLHLIETLTKLVDKILIVANNVDRLTNAGAEESTDICKEIKDEIAELYEIVKEVKSQVQEIIAIAKGNDDKDKVKSNEGKDKSATDKVKTKSKDNKLDKNDDDEEKGCWARFKSCCCCCC